MLFYHDCSLTRGEGVQHGDEGSINIDINESNEIELIVMLDLNIKKLLERCWMKLGSASKSTSFISIYGNL